MSTPRSIQHNGILTATPSGSSVALGSVFDSIQSSFSQTLALSKGATIDLVNVLVGAPVSLPLEAIAKVRVLCLTATGGAAVALITTAAGTAQAIPCSGLLLWQSALPGDEITAVSLYGAQSSVQYFIAGDRT